ncbi:STAS domain-containing protein [Rhodoferax saidenbachensis]|uniref:MlaB-like STAS domain-containing protein n=1 Tax=Rhodoferax saidenbachensis TaxID=1484693 RepID=A0A1P8KDS7_9BURK|nr:STAS domain-containing protein [Rhodoferax saidenbachensis]APW44106.1 hypothetical protein RS694_17255 [Rhodoferax saidenbachensis]
MATKDDRPGLLSKVAMFVRNPTKDWSELDNPEQEQESGYDKQALKAMIERKRQNDFVRKREFDQLRKLRNRDPAAMAGMARASFFQTSISTDPDGRAVTLKKIDEIEAQMSKQWWKGKQDSAGGPQGPGFPVANPVEGAPAGSTAHSTLAPSVPSVHFERTEASEIMSSRPPSGATEFAPTEMGSGMAPMSLSPSSADRSIPARVAMGAMAQGYDGSEVGFSTSKLFAIEVDDMATDPELEEAAIRFANGDDAGAEGGLLDALRGDALLPDVALSWSAALLDLYRATNKRAQFDHALAEFGARFEKTTPVWSSLADGVPAQASQHATGNAPLAASARSSVIWECPADLNVAAMEALREAMSSRPMPWHLGWSSLEQISADAMPLLAGLFSSLCNEPVSLRFSGANNLVQLLRAMTPSGDRGVDAVWWDVRLNALRTLQLQDEFELAALDYCVTYEVAPPAWVEARCQCESVPADTAVTQDAGWASGGANAATAPMGLDGGPATKLELRGEVLGDATQALAGLDGTHRSGDAIVVSCSALVRVDFSAAGSILNWVAVRQSEGCQVQFRDVNRMVAAFFSVIGISEHARVVPRSL